MLGFKIYDIRYLVLVTSIEFLILLQFHGYFVNYNCNYSIKSYLKLDQSYRIARFKNSQFHVIFTGTKGRISRQLYRNS